MADDTDDPDTSIPTPPDQSPSGIPMDNDQQNAARGGAPAQGDVQGGENLEGLGAPPVQQPQPSPTPFQNEGGGFGQETPTRGGDPALAKQKMADWIKGDASPEGRKRYLDAVKATEDANPGIDKNAAVIKTIAGGKTPAEQNAYAAAGRALASEGFGIARNLADDAVQTGNPDAAQKSVTAANHAAAHIPDSDVQRFDFANGKVAVNMSKIG